MTNKLSSDIHLLVLVRSSMINFLYWDASTWAIETLSFESFTFISTLANACSGLTAVLLSALDNTENDGTQPTNFHTQPVRILTLRHAASCRPPPSSLCRRWTVAGSSGTSSWFAVFTVSPCPLENADRPASYDGQRHGLRTRVSVSVSWPSVTVFAVGAIHIIYKKQINK